MEDNYKQAPLMCFVGVMDWLRFRFGANAAAPGKIPLVASEQFSGFLAKFLSGRARTC
jgi:hypothetical protein